MTTIVGLGLPLLTLTVFSLFSMKAPRGSAAMSRMANVTAVTLPVEVVHRYISEDLLHLMFLEETDIISGNTGGVATAIMVPIGMGVNPIFAVVTDVALGGYDILPGFIAGHAIGFIVPFIEEHLPPGLDSVLGVLVIVPIARSIAFLVDSAVNVALAHIGDMISVAVEQSPVLIGLLLGGAIKMICMSPLSSMALTVMLGLTGLPIGTTATACFGGSSIDDVIFKMLHFEDNSNVAAAIMEPLTQARIITRHPIPIHCPNFLGGGSLEVAAVLLDIISDAPGTASPVPGLLAPSAFSPSLKVPTALLLTAISGILARIVGAIVFKKKYDMKLELSVVNSFEEQ